MVDCLYKLKREWVDVMMVSVSDSKELVGCR
jgi:hypothetical protein